MSEQFLISLYFFLWMILYGCKLACTHDVTKPANKKNCSSLLPDCGISGICNPHCCVHHKSLFTHRIFPFRTIMLAKDFLECSLECPLNLGRMFVYLEQSCFHQINGVPKKPGTRPGRKPETAGTNRQVQGVFFKAGTVSRHFRHCWL